MNAALGTVNRFFGSVRVVELNGFWFAGEREGTVKVNRSARSAKHGHNQKRQSRCAPSRTARWSVLACRSDGVRPPARGPLARHRPGRTRDLSQDSARRARPELRLARFPRRGGVRRARVLLRSPRLSGGVRAAASCKRQIFTAARAQKRFRAQPPWSNRTGQRGYRFCTRMPFGIE